jgi:hypothetical protein
MHISLLNFVKPMCPQQLTDVILSFNKISYYNLKKKISICILCQVSFMLIILLKFIYATISMYNIFVFIVRFKLINYVFHTFRFILLFSNVILSRVCVLLQTGFRLVNEFIDHLYTRPRTRSDYSATANLHNSQIITAPSKLFSSLLCLHQPFPGNGS